MDKAVRFGKSAAPRHRNWAGVLALMASAGILLLVQARSGAVVDLEPGRQVGQGAQAKAQPDAQKFKGVWTDSADPTLPADFKLQGEYVGQVTGGGKLGAQVISLGQDSFQAVLLPGGLPGDGWDGQNKILMDGKRDVATAKFVAAAGQRKYNAAKAEEFTATVKFPPPGQKNYTASIADGVLRGTTDDGKAFTLTKTVRTSPMQGLKPPPGALVLFDGTNMDELIGGRLDKERGILITDAKDIITKRKFMDFNIHVEFMAPYRPDARGQARGNSGVYMLIHYEVQILDSFGLDGLKNECGGIYGRIAPKVNMCLPPLQWQTFDVDFSNAVQDGAGKKIKNARATVKHNGVLIHDNVEIEGKTGFSTPRKDPEGTPGVILLQGHGNSTQFKNVWMVEKKVGAAGTESAYSNDHQGVKPLTQTHAHNDYEHTRPLFDALDNGFCSVEADIFLVDGQLLVAHSKKDLKPERTLEKLYLDPLRARIKANGGKVYAGGPSVFLLIDVKSEAKTTYAALAKVLQRYSDILSVVRDDKFVANAVTAVVSGNCDRQGIAAEKVRFASIDGRLTDLDSDTPAHLMPWISASWRPTFKWTGEGPMPEPELAKLREITAKAHKHGRLVRFWATPESPIVWEQLLAGGVDLLNTDQLPEMRKFLTNRSSSK